MPKKVKGTKSIKFEEEDEDEESEEDEEDDLDAELEAEEEESMKVAKEKGTSKKKTRGRPRKPGMAGESQSPISVKRNIASPHPSGEARPRHFFKKRFKPAIQQPFEGILDSESGEIIADSIWAAFAEVLDRLERLENSIGSMMEE